MLKKFLKHLGFHKCKYVKTGYIQAEDSFERYALRRYQCITCGHIKWVDGRYDKYDK